MPIFIVNIVFYLGCSIEQNYVVMTNEGQDINLQTFEQAFTEHYRHPQNKVSLRTIFPLFPFQRKMRIIPKACLHIPTIFDKLVK